MNFKAFTILEMIINLALMSIIVGMVYLVYGYFSKSLSQYSIMSTENFDLELFYSQLEEDFYIADKIVLIDEKKIEIIFYNEEYVNYSWEGKFLYRVNKQKKDSIKVLDFKATSLNPIDPAKKTLIKNIMVQALLYDKEAPLYLYKNYASNYLIATE